MSWVAGNSVVIGLGKTGWSCARFLQKQGDTFVVMDTRENPAAQQAFTEAFPQVPLQCGELQAQALLEARRIIVSPGVPVSHPAIAAAAAVGVPVLGDIELFAQAVTRPVIAITGSNAKSTVTTLVGEMAMASGVRVAVGGNLGEPALDLLDDASVDCYVLELSSFQLETTHTLAPQVATILNISEDHMDRYAALVDYMAAKQRIYRGAHHCVVNRGDICTHPAADMANDMWSFGLDAGGQHSVGVRVLEGREWLVLHGQEKLMPVADIRLPGRHNLENVAAALAIAAAAGWPLDTCADAVRRFAGLPHRCQWVNEKQSVRFYNDSKGTNVGATVAAIRGLADEQSQIVLIAGGDGKGADFHALEPVVRKHVRHLVLIGRDAPLLAEACTGTPASFVASMQDAVQCAAAVAQPGDAVLLSPACASFDMFTGYDDRGRQFCAAVEALS